MKTEPLVVGQVVHRPSKQIRSPYVADVLCDNSDIVLAHSAALGCCGLSDKGATVWMTKIEHKKKKTTKGETPVHCEYRVLFSVIREKGQQQIVGIYPKLAEQLVESALTRNALTVLQNIRSYRRETTIRNDPSATTRSRFDFTGVDKNGTPFILEVKSVPLADYEDVDKKIGKIKNTMIGRWQIK
jgi:DNA-binding sugar fermentation-stimulating protein